MTGRNGFLHFYHQIWYQFLPGHTPTLSSPDTLRHNSDTHIFSFFNLINWGMYIVQLSQNWYIRYVQLRPSFFIFVCSVRSSLRCHSVTMQLMHQVPGKSESKHLKGSLRERFPPLEKEQNPSIHVSFNLHPSPSSKDFMISTTCG